MRLAVVIVTYEAGPGLVATLDALGGQRRPGDAVIVVDNASADGTAERAEAHPTVDRVLRTGANLGFAAGCNRGAAAADADVLLFLNPDCVAEPGALDALREAPAGWAAWSGLVLLEDGTRVNAAGNDVHYLGFAWSARYDAPAAALGSAPVPVPALSGACLAIRREAFAALGGFEESFFLYCEDLDLSLRLRLHGERIGLLPAARVRHGYAFARGAEKWRRLERNRWLVVLRCFPARVLAGVLPAMLVLEPGLLLVGAAGGWAPAKLRAMGGVLAALGPTLRARRRVQATRAVSPAAFAAALRPELDSPFFGAAGRSPAVRAVLRAYWGAVRPRR